MFVYVIGHSPEGPVKIGITAELKKRLMSLRTGHYETMKLLYSVETKDSDTLAIEAYAHCLLSSSRMRGEWFKTTLAKATEAIQCASHLVKVGIHKVVIPTLIMSIPEAIIEPPPRTERRKATLEPPRPMTIKNMPDEIRASITRAAHTSGETCGQWLGRTIVQHAAREAANG